MAATTVSTGYGPTRKTKKSAQREVDAWTNTEPYTYSAMHGRPSYTETIVTEVQEVEGGYACAYVTTREIHDETSCESHDVAGACTQECADLVNEMMGDQHFDPNFTYDPTGCSNPRPRPYEVAEFDAERKAVVIRTEHPEDCACGEIHNEEERIERVWWELAGRAKSMGIDPYYTTRPYGETGPIVQHLKPIDTLQDEINENLAEGEV